MDVKSPETATPDATSRPIIVSSRSMMQDPMLQTEQAEPNLPTSPLLGIKKKKPVDTQKVEIPKDELAKLEVQSDRKLIAPIKEESENSDNSGPALEDDPKLPVKSVISDSAERKQNPELAELTDKKSVSVDAGPEPGSGDVESEEPEEPEEPHESQTDDSEDNGAEPKDEEQDSDAKHKAEEAEQETAEAERLEHIKSLVDEKTYFVQTGHQAGKGGGWLVVFVLLMGAAASAGYVWMMSRK